MRQFLNHWLPEKEDVRLVILYTRHWIHYGMIFFFVSLTVAAAIEGVLHP